MGSLNRAFVAKDDEFYTRYEDVEAELKHYNFSGKSVLCPCDSEESAFVQYFKNNFSSIGLKSLLYTYLGADIIKVYDGISMVDMTCSYADCTDGTLLNCADIVVTNPPFSIYGDIYRKLKVPFILLTPLHKITIKDVFKDFMNNKCRFGYTNPTRYIRPDGTIKQLGNCYWLTSLPVTFVKSYKYVDKMPLQKYYNVNCVFIDKCSNIPDNYYEPMAVPLTFLYGFPFNDFEILGITAESNWNNINKISIIPIEAGQVLKNDEWVNTRIIDAILPRIDGKYLVEGKIRCCHPFKRLIIKRKKITT